MIWTRGITNSLDDSGWSLHLITRFPDSEGVSLEVREMHGDTNTRPGTLDEAYDPALRTEEEKREI